MVKQNEYYNIVNKHIETIKLIRDGARGGGGGKREIIIIPIATLSPPE